MFVAKITLFTNFSFGEFFLVGNNGQNLPENAEDEALLNYAKQFAEPLSCTALILGECRS